MRHPAARLERRQKTRCETAINQNSQNEPGMSAGINEIENRGVEEGGKREGLTAQPHPFARVPAPDWVAHTWRRLPCVRAGATHRTLAHIAKSAMYAPPQRCWPCVRPEA